MRFLMRYEDSQQYGGPEEGGWWWDRSDPLWRFGIPLPLPEGIAYKLCRWLNAREQRKPHTYGYTSVLSHREEFLSYGLEDRFVPVAPLRPRYE